MGNHAKCCMDGKRIRCLQIVSQHVPICLQQFPISSNRKCKKSPFSRTAAHIFVCPGEWRRPCDYHAICCMDRKTIKCLPNPSQHVPIYLEQFPLGTPLGQSRKMLYGCKQNSMLTNCLAACAHQTIIISEIERDIGRKSSFVHTHLAFDAPVKGVPVGIALPRLVWKNKRSK